MRLAPSTASSMYWSALSSSRPLQVLGPGLQAGVRRLQAGVRRLQAGVRRLQAGVRRADGRQFSQDPLAHPVHVYPDGAHLLRAAGVDMVREVTVGHLAGVASQPGQRPDHRYLEAERQHDQDDQQRDPDAEADRVERRRGAVQPGDGLLPLAGQVGLEAVQRGAQAVELGLSLVGGRAGDGLPGGPHLLDGRLRVARPPDAGPGGHPGEVGRRGRHAGEQAAQGADLPPLLGDALGIRGQEGGPRAERIPADPGLLVEVGDV